MHGVSQFITDVKAHAENGNPVFYPCKDYMNQKKWAQIEFVRMHLITRGFMPNYKIWTMHGEVGVNVPQENDNDVAMPDVVMPDVAIHDADEKPGVNTKPMATVNDVFRNTLADNTEDNDSISQLLCNIETGCLSERQLIKLEKMR